MEEFFPLGTIVTLFGSTKPLMIYGRLQLQADFNHIWDYVACLYPEGNISEEYNVFFNHEDVENILFVGYQTEDDHSYQQLLIKKRWQLC